MARGRPAAGCLALAARDIPVRCSLSLKRGLLRGSDAGAACCCRRACQTALFREQSLVRHGRLSSPAHLQHLSNVLSEARLSQSLCLCTPAFLLRSTQIMAFRQAQPFLKHPAQTNSAFSSLREHSAFDVRICATGLASRHSGTKS